MNTQFSVGDKVEKWVVIDFEINTDTGNVELVGGVVQVVAASPTALNPYYIVWEPLLAGLDNTWENGNDLRLRNWDTPQETREKIHAHKTRSVVSIVVIVDKDETWVLFARNTQNEGLRRVPSNATLARIGRLVTTGELVPTFAFWSQQKHFAPLSQMYLVPRIK